TPGHRRPSQVLPHRGRRRHVPIGPARRDLPDLGTFNMRALVVFVLSALMLLVPRPGPAGAQDVTTFKSPEFGILFDYPSGWTVGPGERRGLLPNEVFDVRASPDPLTAYSVAVYYLDSPIPDASLPS